MSNKMSALVSGSWQHAGLVSDGFYFGRITCSAPVVGTFIIVEMADQVLPLARGPGGSKALMIPDA